MTSAGRSAAMLPGVSPSIYGPDDFKAVADIAYRRAGIDLPQAKAMLVYSRLAPLVRDSGCGTFGNYIGRLRIDDEEQARAVAALTTNHTFFYREPHHFEHFAAEVRPDLVAGLHRGGSARLWSAGCSSGEEVWSLVMALLGPQLVEGRRIAGLNVRLLASDIARHALQRASGATYPEPDFAPVPEALRKHWTVRAGSDRAMTQIARSIVRFRYLNLQGQWPMRRQFDAIFCRNVMIYFDNATKERLIARFADALVPGGHLYIGHSERVTGSAASVLEPVGPTIYRKCAP